LFGTVPKPLRSGWLKPMAKRLTTAGLNSSDCCVEFWPMPFTVIVMLVPSENSCV